MIEEGECYEDGAEEVKLYHRHRFAQMSSTAAAAAAAKSCSQIGVAASFSSLMLASFFCA